jgi:uncharacterized lipoprotein YajG
MSVGNVGLMKKILFFTFASFLFSACGEEKQDLTENVNHEGAVETQLNIEHSAGR